MLTRNLVSIMLLSKNNTENYSVRQNGLLNGDSEQFNGLAPKNVRSIIRCDLPNYAPFGT